jgi:hypothetical protein
VTPDERAQYVEAMALAIEVHRCGCDSDGAHVPTARVEDKRAAEFVLSLLERLREECALSCMDVEDPEEAHFATKYAYRIATLKLPLEKGGEAR